MRMTSTSASYTAPAKSIRKNRPGRIAKRQQMNMGMMVSLFPQKTIENSRPIQVFVVVLGRSIVFRRRQTYMCIVLT